MPYIIAITRPGKHLSGMDEAEYAPSRRAVATLGEARTIAYDAIEERVAPIPDGVAGFTRSVDHLSEPGGTVGPLPDGTVIQVEPTTVSDIADTFSMDTFNAMNHDGASEADWIDAFNAREAGR